MKTDTGYAPSEAFCPFALPYDPMNGGHPGLASLALDSSERREQVRCEMGVGITDCSLLLHDRRRTDTSLSELRHLTKEVDNAVAAAYGWTGLDFGHGFHETNKASATRSANPPAEKYSPACSS